MGRTASKVLTSILRAAEFVFAGVVLVVEVLELQRLRKIDALMDEFDVVQIITTTVSAASVLIAALFVWGNYTFKYFLLDFFLAVAWFIMFGFQVAHFTKETCEQGAREVKQLTFGGHCNELRAVWGFAFLSGFMWLGTFATGLWVIWRERRLKSRKKTVMTTTLG